MPRVPVSPQSGLPVNGNAQIQPYSNYTTTLQDFWVANYLSGVAGGVQYIIEIPDDFDSLPKWSIKWTSQTAANDVRWEIRYRLQAVGEDFDLDTVPNRIIITQDHTADLNNPEEQVEETFTMTGTFTKLDLLYIEVFRMGDATEDDKIDNVQVAHLAFDYAA